MAARLLIRRRVNWGEAVAARGGRSRT